MKGSASAEDVTDSAPARESFLQRHPRLRRELYLLGSLLGVGFILMPILIYVVGMLTLGPYASGGWLALFGDLYGALLRGSWPAWGVVLGPLALVVFMRMSRYVYRRWLRPGDTSA